MTKYVDCHACWFRDGKYVLCKKHGHAALQRVADDALDRAISAQPCTYMTGEWVQHAYSGMVGLVRKDLGRKVRVWVSGMLLTWDKKGVRMVAELGTRSIFDDVDQ